MLSIDVVPLALPGRTDLLRQLVTHLTRVLEAAVRVRVPWFDPGVTYDTSRGQYSSTMLLERLLEDADPGPGPVLGVTCVDLFIPVLTYVFGEAQLDGRAAVVSIHRLRPQAFGLPADEALLSSRLQKESIHELGHTFGLVHCLEPHCVMGSSTYVEEIDLKREAFCESCLRFVRSQRACGQAVR